MTKAQKTSINTRRHFLSHLREPKGRGGWLFEDNAGNIVYSFSGTYAEAKKAAITWGTAKGLETLHTCP